VYIRTDDPDLPAFYFDPLINPISLRGFTPKNVPLISYEDTIFGPNDADDDDFELPDEVEPFLEDSKPLKNDMTADAVALWWAPEPYNRRSIRENLPGSLQIMSGNYCNYHITVNYNSPRDNYQLYYRYIPC